MRHFILLAILTLLGLQSFAVTDREMEEAKTITAITYLRYANDASGYLDEHHPKTMAELQSILRSKEKENLKTFTAVRTPSDYASWDKAKLIDYWAGTFYSSPGLIAKGKIGKSRTRSRLNAMKVGTTPQTPAAPAQPAQTPETSKQNPEQTQPKTPAEATPAADNASAVAQADQNAPAAPESQPAPEETISEEIVQQANADSGRDEEEQPRKNNSTWIYILILAILVGVVVWLVVYASKTMKREDSERKREETENGTAPVSDNIAERAANAAMREKYSESLNQKNNELRQAQREISELRAEIERLRDTNSRQSDEISRLRSGLAAMAGPATAAPVHPQGGNHAAAAPSPDDPEHSVPRTPRLRTIYLGRVNPRGLFVRADKTPNPDLSVYRLETEDGYSGTFRVIENHVADTRLLQNPGEWLAGGCTGLDALASRPDATMITTESGGTAIFEGGAWKVIRKARISFK